MDSGLSNGLEFEEDPKGRHFDFNSRGHCFKQHVGQVELYPYTLGMVEEPRCSVDQSRKDPPKSTNVQRSD